MRASPILIAALLGACAIDDDTEPPATSTDTAEVAVPLTNVEGMPTPNWYSRYEGQFEMMNATAFAHSFSRERYVVASRRKTSPYALEYFLIDGQQANPTFGKVILGIQQPLCGAVPCSAISLYLGTTWPQNASNSRAVFVYTSDLWDNDPANPMNPNWGFALMRASNITASGAHQYQDLVDCRKFGGVPQPPKCKIKAPSHASSTRGNGTDRVLVPYLIANNIAVNDWRLGAILFTPGGAQVNQPQVKYCTEPTCQTGNSFILQSRTAYNAQVDRFLVVFAVWADAPVVRGYGQIYNGTTGAPIGGPLDFGPVGSPISGHPIDQQYVGVDSNPNPAQNLAKDWIVFLDDKRYKVSPTGSIASTALAPGVEVANWTLQWVSSPDGRAYERFTDYGPGTPATSERYLTAPGAPVSAAVAINNDTYAENLAHRLASGHSLALWSGFLCFPGIPCGGGLQWRMIDH